MVDVLRLPGLESLLVEEDVVVDCLELLILWELSLLIVVLETFSMVSYDDLVNIRDFADSFVIWRSRKFLSSGEFVKIFFSVEFRLSGSSPFVALSSSWWFSEDTFSVMLLNIFDYYSFF